MSHIIVPLFVVQGEGVKQSIQTLPNHYRLSPDLIVEEVQYLKSIGIFGVILFGLPTYKDPTGTSSYQEEEGVQQAIRLLKQTVKEIIVMADVCLCEYTTHGHCGVIQNQDVDNDSTLAELQKQALSLAKAGADVLAPSGMMDGTVSCLRSALDEAGFTNTLIMNYSVKYASSFYAPFRSAVDSTPRFGDRKTYQMDPANSREAIRKAIVDSEEGADMLMIKPALPSLDIIAKIKERTTLPLAAYQVSGEYAMIKQAAKEGLIDGSAAIYETLLSIKRAGADMIVSYGAKDLYQILKHDPY